MPHILVLHGPNLNLLGTRDPSQYGHESLDDINNALQQQGKQWGYDVTCQQSNSESELITHIHQAPSNAITFIIFNPAAFTHTSIALRDALLAIDTPFIEVHLSNVHAREAFRQQSYFSDIAEGVITGFGANSYLLALSAVDQSLTQRTYTQADGNA